MPYLSTTRQMSASSPHYKWTAHGLSVEPSCRDYICYRWMETPPDSELMVLIGSVYGIQVVHGSPFAEDSLRCFYTVHGIVCAADGQQQEMTGEDDSTAYNGYYHHDDYNLVGCKRARGGCEELLSHSKKHAR